MRKIIAASIALIFAFCGLGLAQYGNWVSIDSLNAMAVGGDRTSLVTTLDKTLVIDEDYQKSISANLQATGVNTLSFQSLSSLTIQDGDAVRTEGSNVYQTLNLPGEFSVVMSQGHDVGGDPNARLTSAMAILDEDGEEIFSIFGSNFGTDVDVVIDQALKDYGVGVTWDQINALQTIGFGNDHSASQDGVTYSWGNEKNTVIEIEV